MRHTIFVLILLFIAPGCRTPIYDGDDDDDDSTADDDDTTAADDDTTADDDDDDTTAGDDDATADDDDTCDYDPTPADWPPTRPGIAVEPASPGDDDPLLCTIITPSTDAEGETVSYSYSWTVDTVSMAVTTPEVPPAMTHSGEIWACHVTPNDGLQDGAPGIAGVGIDSVGTPYGFMVEMGLEAVGGGAGGAATVELVHTMIDVNQNPLCSVYFEFDADYTHGTGQGPDLWTEIDEVLTWTAGGEVANSCPSPDWAIYEGDAVEYYEWYWHPMAFVSCDHIAAAGLGGALLGIDDSGYIPTVDGTFGDYCASVGPEYESELASGPMEGVWLLPGSDGDLDGLGNFNYFAPQSQANVETWMLMGLLMADASNPCEAINGLWGRYVTVPFWLWVYSG